MPEKNQKNQLSLPTELEAAEDRLVSALALVLIAIATEIVDQERNDKSQ